MSLSLFPEALDRLERQSTVDIAGPRTLVISASAPLVCSLTRLRETAAGVGGEIGEAIGTGVAVRAVVTIDGGFATRVSLDSQGRVRVSVARDPESGRPFAARVAACELAEAPPSAADDPPPAPERGNPGPLAPLVAVEAAAAVAAERLAARLCHAAGQAGRQAPLLDHSFAAGDAGRELLRRALTGDYSWLGAPAPDAAEFHPCEFGSVLLGESAVELLVQPERRRRKSGRGVEPASLPPAEAGCGRWFAVTDGETPPGYAYNAAQSLVALAAGWPSLRAPAAGAATLAFFDARRLPRHSAAAFLPPALAACGLALPPAEISAGAGGDTIGLDVTLEMDAESAGAWWDAPGESDPLFFETYSRVSVAVQQALRAWLPYLCLAGHARLEAPETALPMLVYAASRPFHGRPKYEFTYDVLREPSMAALFRCVGRPLAARLLDVRRLLSEAGRRDAARQFDPDEVKKSVDFVRARPRHLHALLSAEAAMVGALVRAGCECARLREAAAGGTPDARCLPQIAGQLAKTLNDRLRRLYAGQELLAAGGLVLVEATHALNEALGRPSEIRAVLRFGGDGAPRGGRIVTAARACRPAAAPPPPAAGDNCCEFSGAAPLPFGSPM